MGIFKIIGLIFGILTLLDLAIVAFLFIRFTITEKELNKSGQEYVQKAFNKHERR